MTTYHNNIDDWLEAAYEDRIGGAPHYFPDDSILAAEEPCEACGAELGEDDEHDVCARCVWEYEHDDDDRFAARLRHPSMVGDR